MVKLFMYLYIRTNLKNKNGQTGVLYIFEPADMILDAQVHHVPRVTLAMKSRTTRVTSISSPLSAKVRENVSSVCLKIHFALKQQIA